MDVALAMDPVEAISQELKALIVEVPDVLDMSVRCLFAK